MDRPPTLTIDQGASLEVSGSARAFDVVAKNLRPNTVYTWSVEGPVESGGCSRPLELNQDSFTVDGWTLREELTTAPATPPQAPYFREVSQEAGLGSVGIGGRVLIADVDGDELEDLVVWPINNDSMTPTILKRTLQEEKF